MPSEISEKLKNEEYVDEITKSLGGLLFFPMSEIFEIAASGDDIDINAIAERYKLPKGYIEYILSDTIVSLLKKESA